MRRYTIEEIRAYLEGCKFTGGTCSNEWNQSLLYAIHELEDHEDGIEAFTERNEEHNETNK